MNVSVNAGMVTTAFELPGYHIVKNLWPGARHHGAVAKHFRDARGIAANHRRWKHHPVRNNVRGYARASTLDLMMEHAIERGANAVIGTRYDATEVMQGVTEVIAYGTAVQVERNT